MREFLRRIGYLFGRRRFDAELAEEMAFHRTLAQEAFERAGATPIEAERAARRALGSRALATDQAHDVWCPVWLQGLGQDIRLAVRSHRSAPVVSLVAVLSLALGIGANSAVFSIVNALLVRPLPVEEPWRLGILAGRPGPSQMWTYAIWDAVRERVDAFAGAAAWCSVPVNLANGGEARPAQGLFASGAFFDVLGVRPVLGRSFTADDDRADGGAHGPVAVVSHRFWQREFDGQPNVIGASILVEQVAFTIVGVAPPEFFGPEVGRRFDVAVPLATERLIRGRDSAIANRLNWFLTVILRLRPGQEWSSAVAALQAIQPDVRQAAMPPGPNVPRDRFMSPPFYLAPLVSGTSPFRSRYAAPVMLMLAVVALVLLIACGNLANLLLARAAARRQELSARLAIGGSTWRLARQFLIESLVLASAGAVAGLALAFWGSRFLVARISTTAQPFFLDLSLDPGVLAFTIAVTILTALVFGAAPAWRAARVSPMEALRMRGAGMTHEGRMRLSSGLIVAQVSLSIVLVIGAALFGSTFTRLTGRATGFDQARLVVINVNANRSRVAADVRTEMYHRLAEAIASVPGVASAAGSATTPLNGSAWGSARFDVPGTAVSERDGAILANYVTPGWFATYGVPLLAGRDFASYDTADAPRVIIVNQQLAYRLFGNESPIGRTIVNSPIRTSRVIVGVVADSVYANLRDAQQPTMYLPVRQFDWSGVTLPGISVTARALAGSPTLIVREIARRVSAFDGDLAFNVRLVEDQVHESLSRERLLAMLSAFFGALGIFLAGLGLYGLASCVVSQRRREIGVRMALGASQAEVVRGVLVPLSRLVAAGIVLGGTLSYLLSRLVVSLLYGVDGRDPMMFMLAAAVLAVTGLAAGALPAWRASRIDPALTLRGE